MAADVVSTLYSAFVRSGAAKKAQEKRIREGESAAERLKKAKSISSDVLAKNGIRSLNHPDVVSEVRYRQLDKVEIERKLKSERRKRLVKLTKAVKTLRLKHGMDDTTHLFSKCTKDECGAYLQYKKKPREPAMPKELEDRRQRCIEWMSRPSPPCSPHASDEEVEDANAFEECGVNLYGSV